MTLFDIGPATLLISDNDGRQRRVTDLDDEPQDAWEVQGVVVAPDGLRLELAYQRWAGAGAVIALSRGDSPLIYDRLVRRERLTIREQDGVDYVVADLLHWDPTRGLRGWEGPKKATQEELSSTLGTSAASMLFGAGAIDFGTRARVLGDISNAHKNRLAVLFPSRDPLGPLAVYVLTRVLPIVNARLAQ